jgi:vacuolar-type H+-ATPase subunit H
VRGGRVTTERSLLQKIREKELEINIQADVARREAEENIAGARKDADAILKKAEAEAKTSAEELTRREMEAITMEIGAMRSGGGGEIRTLKEKGERNLGKAIEQIIHVVAPE